MNLLVDGVLSSHYSDLGKTVRCGVIGESVDEISSRVFCGVLELSSKRSKTSFREYWGDELGLTFRPLNSFM